MKSFSLNITLTVAEMITAMHEVARDEDLVINRKK